MLVVHLKKCSSKIPFVLDFLIDNLCFRIILYFPPLLLKNQQQRHQEISTLAVPGTVIGCRVLCSEYSESFRPSLSGGAHRSARRSGAILNPSLQKIGGGRDNYNCTKERHTHKFPHIQKYRNRY